MTSMKPSSSSSIIEIRDRMIRGERFAWEEVSSWIQSGDLELMGAAFQVLTSEVSMRGELDEAAASNFVLRFSLLALSGAVEHLSTFGLQPYAAGHWIAGLYKRRRPEGQAAADTLKRIRDELARLYLTGDERQKRRVVDGVLEHIFEDPPSRNDFTEWQRDPRLQAALREAREWIS